MSTGNRNTHASCTHFSIDVHNFFSFPVHFHLFLGIIIIKENINMRNNIHGQLILKLLYSNFFSVCYFLNLMFQLSNPLGAGTTCCLISCNVNPFNFRQFFYGFQCHNHLNGRTVWIGNNVSRPIFRIFRIYFGNYQRYIVIVTKCAGVVNHYCTIFGNCSCKFL